MWMFLAQHACIYLPATSCASLCMVVTQNMAKTNATRRRTRQSKVVTNEVNVNTEGQTETEEDASTKSTEMKDRDEQDSQMDTVIEVKGSASTVTVSWDKKNEEGEVGDQMMESDSQVDKVAGENEHEKKNEEGGRDAIKKDTSGVNGKRKAQSTAETSPSKKTKLINDGFCLYVGNLNNSKAFEEVKNSLANYFMTQGLLVQDIRLDRSKKHAHVDLASEMDLSKALTLNGEMVLDKPMKIAKAKVKGEKVKVKVTAEERKAAKDGRCLFLKNVPCNTTKKKILKLFRKAVAVRFPGGTEGPEKGIAFVEFKNTAIPKKLCQKKRAFKLHGQILIVDSVGKSKVPKVTKADDDDDDSNNTKVAAPPNNTLFLSNLSYNVKENKLKKVFPKAVSVNVPQSNGKPRRFAFVEFATVEEAEKALQSSQNMKICKREVRVQFCATQATSEKVLSKTLIVMGLAEKTTAETLKSAFEGALSARVTLDKITGVSKRFGFVDFEREDNCKAVKEAMEDCEIDGSKVTVAYAKPAGQKRPPRARGGSAGRPPGQPAGQAAGRGGRGGRGRGATTPQDAVKEVENKVK